MSKKEPAIHEMHCQEPWFSYIRNQIKPVEGRKNTLKHQQYKVGDYIRFYHGKKNFLTMITKINLYPSLDAYLHDVSPSTALPYIDSFDEAKKIYLQWSTEEEIKKWGFLGIFVKVIEE
jgi:ASC-1-like (ASCH) protein